MDSNELIINAIETLGTRLDQRFDHVDTRLEGHNIRVTAIETDLVRFKTGGFVLGAALSFLGWDHIKPWLTTLTK